MPVVTLHNDGSWSCDCGLPRSPRGLLNEGERKNSWCWHVRYVGMEEKKKEAKELAEGRALSERQYAEELAFLKLSETEYTKEEAERLARKAEDDRQELERMAQPSVDPPKRRIFMEEN